MPNTVLYIAAGLSVFTAVVTLVVLPMLAYIVRRGDQADDRRDARLDTLERRDASHDVAITELRGKVDMIALVHGDVREMRDKMLTREEFERRISALEREIRPGP